MPKVSPSLRAALVDPLQDVAGCIARDVARSEQLGAADRGVQVGIVLDGRGVVGDAADTGCVELAPRPIRTRSGVGLLNSMNSPRDISISRICSRFNWTIMSSIERL